MTGYDVDELLHRVNMLEIKAKAWALAAHKLGMTRHGDKADYRKAFDADAERGSEFTAACESIRTEIRQIRRDQYELPSECLRHQQ